MQCRVQENAALAKRGAEPGVEFDVLAFLNLLDVPHCDEVGFWESLCFVEMDCFYSHRSTDARMECGRWCITVCWSAQMMWRGR